MNEESTRPPDNIRRVWCDFNACGWSGLPDDNCYYVLSAEDLKNAQEGELVFIYDSDNGGHSEIFGCIAKLNWYRGTASSGWRACPTNSSFYREKSR
jgi:hypothetical protein